MPLTPEQKTQKLLRYGMDPKRYRLEDDDQTVSEIDVEPVVTNTPVSVPQPAPQKMGAMQAIATTAPRSIVPTLGGLAGAGGVMGLAALGGVTLGPVGAIALPLAGGFGGSWLAGKAQEAVAPPSPEKIARLQQARTDQPVASAVGELLPSLIALRPSPAQLGEAASGLRELTTKGLGSAALPTLSRNQISALANAGIGGAIGAGSEIAAAKMAGEEVDPKRVLVQALGNALISEPNKLIGQRVFGFHPTEGRTSARPTIENSQDVNLRDYAAPEVLDQPMLTPEFRKQMETEAAYQEKSRQVADAAYEQTVAEQARAKQLDADLVNAQQRLVNEQKTAEIANIEAQIEQLKTPVKPASENAKRYLEPTIERNRLAGPEVRPVEATDVESKTVLTPEEASAPMTEAERIQDEYDRGIRHAEGGSDVAQQTNDILEQKKIERSGVLNPATRKLAARVADRLGYTYQETTGKIVNPADGKEVPGRALVKQAIAEVNPTSPNRGEGERGFGLDTPLHEIAHLAVEDMRQNGTPFEKKMIARGEELFGGNEGLVKNMGLREVYNQYSGEHVIPKYLRLLWKHIKLRFGAGTAQDRADWLAARMMDAPAVGERMQVGDVRVKPLEGEQRPATAEGGSKLAPTQEARNKRMVDLSSTEGQSRIAEMRRALGIEKTPTTAADKKSLATLPQQKLAEGGSEIAPKQTDTPEFKRWFEGSKVVDENGQPRVVYHGTGSGGFNTFKLSKEGMLGKGIYLSPNHEFASSYAKQNQFGEKVASGSVYPLYAKLKNPVIVEHDSFAPAVDVLQKLGLTKQKASDLFEKALENKGNLTGEIFTKAQKAGYDGIIIMNKGKMNELVAFSPEQIKSATGNRGTFDPTNPDIRMAEGGSDIAPTSEKPEKMDRTAFAPVLTSQVNKMRDYGPSGNYVADKAEKFFAAKSYYEGQLGETFKQIVHDMKLDEGTDTAALKYLWNEYHGLPQTDAKGKPLELPADVLAKVGPDSEFRKMLYSIADFAGEKGVRVINDEGNARLIQKDPNYVPNMLSSDVASEWSHNIASKKSTDAIESMTQWILKKDDEIANIQDLDQAYNAAYDIAYKYAKAVSKGSAHDSAEFAALRRAKGVGLPWDLMEKSLERLVYRYGRRAAKDIAFHEMIQSDRAALKALDLRDAEGKKVSSEERLYTPEGKEIQALEGRDVQALKRSILDKPVQDLPRIKSLSKLVSSMIMQVPTGLRDIASIPVNAIPYMGVGEGMRYSLNALHNIIGDYRAAVRRTQRAGAARSSMSDFVMGDTDAIKSRLDKMASFLSKWGGREATETAARTFTYALGEEVVKSRLAAARAGDGDALKWLQRFGSSIKEGVDAYAKPSTPPPTAEITTKLAKEFVDAVQGGYDARNLPTWALEGSIAPFVSLQRWGIEKANTIHRDVWKPMTRGDYGPFLRYSLGALMTGVAIEQLNKLISNSRGYDASTEEVLKSDEAGVGDFAKKFVSLMQMSAYGGIVSDVAKLGLATAKGDYSKYNSPLSYPLYSYLTDTVAKNVSDYVEAMKAGEDPVATTGRFVQALTTQSLQNGRTLERYVNSDETKRREMIRDMRVWNELRGNKQPDAPDLNRFMGADERRFKTTQDIDEAVRLGGELTQRALDEGDINKTAQKLSSLRRMPISWSPSMQEKPMEFQKYVDFIRETQGEEAANRLVEKYVGQTAVNKVKTQLIPSFANPLK